MSIEIISELVQKNDQSFALMDDSAIRGGFHCINLLSDLININPDVRKYGMYVFVQENASIYILQSDLVTWIQQNSNSGATEALVQLTYTAPTLACLRIADSIAYKITSIDYNAPICDGVLLESGNNTEIRSCAITHGFIFDSPLLVPGINSDILYLGQTGNLTNIEPSLIAGDTWYLIVARKVNDQKFIFSPQLPIKLS
jgi:hypothetical protein